MSPVVSVVPGASIGDTAWDAFVKRHPNGSAFHLRAWRTVVNESLGHRSLCLAAVDANQTLHGVLPLAETKSKLFGHAVVSIPGGVEAGVLSSEAEVAALLLDTAKAQAQALGASHLELRHRAATATSWSTHPEPLYFSFRKALADNAEAIMLAIPRKQRAEVRKGINAGCTFEVDQSSDRFYALYADNVRRHGTPGFAKHHFDTIKRAFGDDCEFAIVRNGAGKAISGVMSVYAGDTIFPYYAGDLPEARQNSANDFKYYALMAHAQARGAKVFDYGRSKVGTGPYHFKKNWGFEPVPYHYEFALLKGDHIPQNNPLNPKYALAIATWRKLPLALVNRIGHPLARHLC
jgi:FemAB-related protein (PEP-CTERM system-associated)